MILKVFAEFDALIAIMMRRQSKNYDLIPKLKWNISNIKLSFDASQFLMHLMIINEKKSGNKLNEK